MVDKAIDKLIEEMREASDEYLQAVADEKYAEFRRKQIARRREILKRTMEKHIYERMPILQAKMLAHEELENVKL